MPSIDSLAAFLALALAIIVIPGPSVMFIVSRAVALGRRAAVLTVLGNAAGAYCQVIAVAVGVGALVERSIAVFTAIKLIGAGYLIWLGIDTIRHRRAVTTALSVATPSRSPRAVFREGFVVGLANPKLIVFFAAILPQFVEPSGAPAGLQMLFLGLVFTAVAVISDGSWGLAAGTARTWFARSPARIERLSAAGGAAIVGLGLHLALTGRRS